VYARTAPAIDPSGAHQTGSFDKIRELVESANKDLAPRFHIWGKTKLVNFLQDHLARHESSHRASGHG